jgi:aspartyl-tRNA(Asn)/glutamyl-tRNA(Gln) amidotransferase subunit A
MSDLHYLSATEAVALFQTRDLSPVELMAAVIARAEAVEPTINAFSETFFDQAMERAREAERAYLRGEARPLEGIPVAIKEEMRIAGHRMRLGSLVVDEIADDTATVVQRIFDAGGIMHARTTTPEFSSQIFTHSRLWGVTRNPWNPDLTPGGSSGGSGAALAAGSTTLATGSDIGGSIRIPATFCGVVGFKPPYGRVPQDPVDNLDTYCHNGPLARTVDDAALLENVIAGPDPRDIATLRPKLELPLSYEGIEGWRVAVSPDLGCYDVDDEVRANTLAAAAALREAGATVVEVSLPWRRDDIRRAALIHYAVGMADWVATIAAGRTDDLNPYVLAFTSEGEGLELDAVAEGVALEAGLYPPLGELLEGVDALLCPTMAVTGLLAGDDEAASHAEINGLPAGDGYDITMAIPFNIMSRCPVVNVPSGFASNGIPTGLQIVARTFDDERAFRVAAALERVRPWLDSPERRPKM